METRFERTARHPSRTPGYRGAHVDADRSFRFEIRSDRAISCPREPNTGVSHAGGSFGDRTSRAAASVSKNSRWVTGSSSATLYAPDGKDSADATAAAASS